MYEIASKFASAEKIDEAIKVLKEIIAIDADDSFAQRGIITLNQIKERYGNDIKYKSCKDKELFHLCHIKLIYNKAPYKHNYNKKSRRN